MDEPEDRSLHERVERLERIVEDLQLAVRRSREAPLRRDLHVSRDAGVGTPPRKAPAGDIGEIPSRLVSKPQAIPPRRPPPLQKPRSLDPADVVRKSQYGLSIVGIALLLLGIAFLFKYSIDQGWINEPVRVGFGVVLGIGLLTIGLHIHSRRRHLSQVLLGGSVATFYVTEYAAFQLYSLVSWEAAFALMAGTTALAFLLALRQDEAVLSIIGAVGGLAIPFLLYTGDEGLSNAGDSGSLAALVGYTCLVLGGTSAIYLARGWRLLLWTSVIGGWVVLLTAYIRGIPSDPLEATDDRWALQLGILVGWTLFWVLPVVREVLSERNPTQWPRPPLPFLGDGYQEIQDLVDRHVHVLSVLVPVVTLALSAPIWSLPTETWGLVMLGGAAVYGLASWILRCWDGTRQLAYTQALVALLFLSVAFCLLLHGDALFLVLVAEATVLYVLSHRLSDRVIETSAHILFGALGVWFLYRLLSVEVEGTPIFNVHALTELSLVVAALGVSALLKLREARAAYQLCAHVAILGWLLRQLSALPDGQAYVTISWGAYAVALLILGLRLNHGQLRMVAMVTVFVVVGKLILVDLVMLEPVWRVLLFLGFGGIFLVLSYYLQDLWKPESEPVENPECNGDPWYVTLLFELEYNAEVGRTLRDREVDVADWPEEFLSSSYGQAVVNRDLRTLPPSVFEDVLSAYSGIIEMRRFLRGGRTPMMDEEARQRLMSLLEDTTRAFETAAKSLRGYLAHEPDLACA